MPTPFAECALTVRRLYEAARGLERASDLLELDSLDGREWFELLRQKLLPQLGEDAYLVVAVVGGTNIGKSVIFNHIAGSRVSSTSPLASGTKHPVCLVPPGFAERVDLSSIFQGFDIRPWTKSEEALEDDEVHRLYWKVSEHTPEKLLVLDTPDIDSDATVNWQRADNIRRCADVLIAVLTQQKYNDAAVKRFFRTAALEDKAVIVVFNQCELPDDDDYWPLWLETFSGETNIRPEFVYIAPADRSAAEENRLPFYERRLPGRAYCDSVDTSCSETDAARDLADDLSRLRFSEIKLRALRGSLTRLLDTQTGVAAYVREIEGRSGEFAVAARRLSQESVVKVQSWPAVSNTLLVAEVRKWWKTQQEGWARHVNRFYDGVSGTLLLPFRYAYERMRSEPEHPWDQYRKEEWAAVLQTIENVFDKLTWMSESGSALLRPRFEKLLTGKSREALIERLKLEHAEADLELELAEAVAGEMETFQKGSPHLYHFYRQLNNTAAAARPVVSVVLFTMGWGPAGEVVAPFVANAVAHTIVPIVADMVGGTAAAVAGEAAAAKAAGQGAGYLQAKFQELQAAFTTRRAAWLATALRDHLLESLPDELRRAADVPQSEAFRNVVDALETLMVQLKAEKQETSA